MYVQIDKRKLLSKGWSQSEIENASAIIEQAENKRHIGAKFLDKTTYWALLFLLIIGNAVCSAFLIPLIFAFQGTFAIVITTILGFAFGVFFSILIADIKKTEKHHIKGLFAALIVSGIVNFALIARMSIEFSTLTGLALRHDPYLIGEIYLFAFLTPHIVLMIGRYQKQ